MTGMRKPHLEDLCGRIRELLARAPLHNPSTARHLDVDLHTWFDMTDLLITDVSSLISDFLAWDRPYVVANPLRLSLEDFRRRFPSTAAAYVIDPQSAALPGILASALEHDPLRSRRLESRRLFLGDDERDPLDQFIAAVDALYESTGSRPV
jgi:CDP-glycerol glycerophosphotransferase (TagB/SpsB family)